MPYRPNRIGDPQGNGIAFGVATCTDVLGAATSLPNHACICMPTAAAVKAILPFNSYMGFAPLICSGAFILTPKPTALANDSCGSELKLNRSDMNDTPDATFS